MSAQPDEPLIPNQHRPGEPAAPWTTGRGSDTGRATSRLRRPVRDLPSWDPLPPGEILVNRTERDRSW